MIHWLLITERQRLGISFVAEPDFHPAGIDILVGRNPRHRREPIFLNASTAPATWVWRRGRADSLR